ncbi:Response regulator receiver domain-containing protein [Dyadobacter soli]|uniref:Response regulator receiver domain-containing protein n=1 Tax=Dyadobacter soli TaxID=659014 RepID=A0A1G8BPJ1_9BACT|nr:response regulator [Dyadobacter soli]SDH35137.1 Response regulator receiver domain-containing protein [Dyadobacter soli]
MNIDGEIIIIEDDEEDRNVLEYVFEKLGYSNRRAYFEDGASALAYLEAPYPEPFLILSDIDLPYMDGADLNTQLSTDTEIRRTGIPYLYLTNGSTHKHVIDAYSKLAQGFFIKPNSPKELISTLKAIIDYWLVCAIPSESQRSAW